jgi:hypothetical protein
VHKHLANTPATAKGRLKLRPSGHYSTHRLQPTHSIANVFCFAALANKQRGTFYTDCTGNLPTRALTGQQLFFIAYDYDTNYIFAIPIMSMQCTDIITAFKSVFQTLSDKVFKPTFNDESPKWNCTVC